MASKVKDVMTSQVVCVRPSTTYKELVRVLTEQRLSAVPVVDDQRRVLGVVSEADLLLRYEQRPMPSSGSWWKAGAIGWNVSRPVAAPRSS